jgi:hypothetical protein
VRSRVSIAALDGSVHLRYETEAIHLEAPNWTRDGRLLVLNGNGALWRLPVEEGGLEQIPIDGVPKLNNDHVLDPDGEHIYLSANDWHIYRAPLAGGTAKRITSDTGLMHFLHGVSPDGAELAFVGLEPKDGNWWARESIHGAVRGRRGTKAHPRHRSGRPLRVFTRRRVDLLQHRSVQPRPRADRAHAPRRIQVRAAHVR